MLFSYGWNPLLWVFRKNSILFTYIYVFIGILLLNSEEWISFSSFFLVALDFIPLHFYFRIFLSLLYSFSLRSTLPVFICIRNIGTSILVIIRTRICCEETGLWRAGKFDIPHFVWLLLSTANINDGCFKQKMLHSSLNIGVLRLPKHMWVL